MSLYRETLLPKTILYFHGYLFQYNTFACSPSCLMPNEGVRWDGMGWCMQMGLPSQLLGRMRWW